MSADSSARPPFRKVLWEAAQRQHYPDNYVDAASFLAGLRVNEGHRYKSYEELFVEIIPVVQHVASIFTFAAVFAHLYAERITPESVLWATSSSTLLGYVAWETALPARKVHRPRAALLAFILPLLLVLLSPVLKALTESTTSDTIWSLAGVLLAFNALLADHSREPQPLQAGEGFPAALSLNAAMCAATVLASRLDAHAAVASLLLFAGAWFALLPSVRQLAFAPVELAICFAALLPHGRGLTAAAMVLLGAIGFGTPLALWHANQYKDQLRGEWDQAEPQTT